MSRKVLFMVMLIAIVLISAGTPLPASAGGAARIWLVHGIHGQDVGQAAVQYPLDVWIDGAGCVSRNLVFMGVKGPIAVPPGTLTIKYSPASKASPCSQPAVFTGSISVEGGGAYSVVTYLNGAGAQTVSTYPMDLSRSTRNNGKARYTFVHAAYSGAVDVFKRQKGTTKNVLAVNDLYNGQAASYMDRSGQWKYWFNAADSGAVLHGPMVLNTKTHYAYFIFLVGSANHGHFTASFSVSTKR